MSTKVGPVLLIGGSGMLGRAWSQLLQQRGIPFRAPRHAELDITDPATIEAHVMAETPVVVNCAAWTDVDGAESNEAAADRLNADAVGFLARRCAAVGATLVHYSTDYIFTGHATKPYPVDGETGPLNAYGRGKLKGEEQLRAAGDDHLLIRTSWLYAPWGKNFVRTIAKLSAERPSLRVVNDQRGRPTSCEHLASATLQLLERSARGTWHVTDGGECTWYDFASAIAQRVNPACVVEPCRTDEFPRPAKRPAYSVLDLSKTEAMLGRMPDWRDNLADVLNRLE